MLETVKVSLLELFRLLGHTTDSAEKEVKELLLKIEEEALFEVLDGLKEEKKKEVKDFSSINAHVEDEVAKKILETACSKILVAYFAKNKKGYSENQKEIFLTFLVTNKIKRELDRD